ncbi:hypothetical protein H8356DRAFT_1437001 [Neocallimastix lanati (nom. inval.)]|nr:hypothetical protein H8356DRAFT_1437001 [Neocallimastix sp. JGI-2020a]
MIVHIIILKKKYDLSLSIMKHKIKDGIEKSSILMIYMFRIYSIKSQISRNLNKNYHPIYQIFIIRTYAIELDNKLNELEHLPYYEYQRKIRGIWKI